jgi:predicted ATP-grasp superfamily ATP-dependent carboligase
MRILVTDGDSRAALAVTRALGPLGHEVWVGAPREPSLAHTSRHCARRITYPDPVRDPAGFLDAVASTAASGRIDLLLPVTEITTLAITGARDRFEPGCQVPFASAAAIDAASNKADLLARAGRLGIPIPRTTVVASPDAPLDHDLPFPVVVKPHRSRVWTDDGWVSGAVSHAADRAALERDLAGRPRALFPLLLQERIVGPGVGVFACYDRGRPIATFSHRRLREKPPEGGVSVLCESTAVPPVAGELAQRLLRDLDWHGVAMVEFKQDDRDDTPRLMEINARFWGSLQLATDAGVNFPGLLVALATGSAPAAAPAYRVGVRSRWFWGDVDATLLRLFGHGPARATTWGARASCVAAFLHLWGRNLHYDNPKLNDIRPWLYETRRHFRGED